MCRLGKSAIYIYIARQKVILFNLLRQNHSIMNELPYFVPQQLHSFVFLHVLQQRINILKNIVQKSSGGVQAFVDSVLNMQCLQSKQHSYTRFVFTVCFDICFDRCNKFAIFGFVSNYSVLYGDVIELVSSNQDKVFSIYSCNLPNKNKIRNQHKIVKSLKCVQSNYTNSFIYYLVLLLLRLIEPVERLLCNWLRLQIRFQPPSIQRMSSTAWVIQSVR